MSLALLVLVTGTSPYANRCFSSFWISLIRLRPVFEKSEKKRERERERERERQIDRQIDRESRGRDHGKVNRAPIEHERRAESYKDNP